jgi:hypothetical protein
LTKVFAAPTCVPLGLTHPTVTWLGVQRKNTTLPVGVAAPAGPLTVTVSVTVCPCGKPDVFGIEVVATVGVAGLTVSWAEPEPPPFNPLVTPSRLTLEIGSVQIGPPPVHGGTAGFDGTFRTLRLRLTVQVLAAAGPFAGPRMTSDDGVSWTSPDPAAGAPIVKVMPAHGVVAPFPTAVSTEKTPGSWFAAGSQTEPPEVTLQAGIKKRESSLMFSVSFGDVERLTTVTLALIVWPTVTTVG